MKARGMHVTRMLAGWKNQMEKREVDWELMNAWWVADCKTSHTNTYNIYNHTIIESYIYIIYINSHGCNIFLLVFSIFRVVQLEVISVGSMDKSIFIMKCGAVHGEENTAFQPWTNRCIRNHGFMAFHEIDWNVDGILMWNLEIQPGTMAFQILISPWKYKHPGERSDSLVNQRIGSDDAGGCLQKKLSE